MASNKEISRLLNLYSELLQLHGKDERLSQLLSGASYRIRQIEEPIRSMEPKALSTLFRPEIVVIISELNAQGNISDLEELIQLTPPGLFDMMRIKGLGGKKLAILWKQAKIDNVEELLKKARAGEIAAIKGFGSKTQANIINAIENLHAGSTQFHYADLADVADSLVSVLQKTFKTELVSLCGEIRRQTLTVKKIEILVTATAKKLSLQLSAECCTSHQSLLITLPATRSMSSRWTSILLLKKIFTGNCLSEPAMRSMFKRY